MDWGTLIGGILSGGLLVGAASLYRAPGERRAKKSDAASTALVAASGAAEAFARAGTLMVEPLQKDLIASRERIVLLEKSEADCEARVAKLAKRVSDLEHLERRRDP